MDNPQEAIALLEKVADLCDQEGAPICRGEGLRSISKLLKKLVKENARRQESLVKIKENFLHVGELNVSLINNTDPKKAFTNLMYTVVEDCYKDAASQLNKEIKKGI